MIVLSVLFILAAGILLLPSISDLISFARIGVRGPIHPSASDEFPALLFLVSAHNEEAIIGGCLDSLLQLDYPRNLFSILVVADNCHDRTADVAQRPGVRVLERNEPTLQGKPHAIAWAIKQIPIAQHDALVIVDADSEVEPGLGRGLALRGPLREKALQSYNDVSNPDENAQTRMAELLSVAYYRFMFPLKRKAGLNVPLTGAGMCVGMDVLERWGWTAFSIGEDIEMYVHLTLRGVKIEDAPEARIRSLEASTLRISASQRRRWRAGRLTLLGRLGWMVLRSQAVGVHQRLDMLAELAAPGPAVHLGAAGILATAALLLPIPGGQWAALFVLLSLGRPIVYTILAVSKDPKPLRAISAFLYLPIYTVWRLGTELSTIITLGDKSWVRTRRADEEKRTPPPSSPT